MVFDGHVNERNYEPTIPNNLTIVKVWNDGMTLSTFPLHLCLS